MSSPFMISLETATDQTSVCITLPSGQHDCITLHGAKQQTLHILPTIDQLIHTHELQISQLAAVAYSRGPGAFSGIRVGAAVAQALSFARQLPVYAINTLDAFAVACLPLPTTQPIDVHVVVDAKMNELYYKHIHYAAHDDSLTTEQPHTACQLMPINALAEAWSNTPISPSPNTYYVGNGLPLLQAAVHADTWHSIAQCTTLPQLLPSALHIAQCAYPLWQAGVHPSFEQSLPVYLRDNAWKKLTEQSTV